ncbi:MAG: hypothetical protein HDS75_00330 [Bacteroidales bacterium]|nr:hypothetical protein [Bacteroidales bacterium]MDE6802664.1 hypothetical protein [Muribaculaceae bacterium]
MKLINYLIATIIGLTLTSCLGESTNVFTQDYSSFTFDLVTDNTTSNSVLSTSSTLKVKTDANTGRLTIDINNLELPGAGYINISLPDRIATIGEDGSQRVNVPAFTSVVNGQTHMVTSFDMKLYVRYLNGQSYNLLVLSYDVDSKYSVRTIFSPAYYWGNTVVIDQDNKSYTNTAQTSFYGFGFDPEKKVANIGLVNAKFAENMPGMSMTFETIPVTFAQNHFTMKADEVIPKINNVPFPSYKISDLTVSGNYGGPVAIQFTCTIDTEKVKGQYRVSAQLDVFPPKAVQN